jgi:hypothetical protein
MDIKKCENCGEYYGKKNENCTKCGFKNNEIEIETNIKLVAGLITIGIFIALFFGIKSFFSQEFSNSDNSSTYKQLSYNYAEKYVKQKLKSPSSAKFPSLFERQDHISRISDTEYKINSWVESQNSFGAMIKTRFSCTIKIKNDVVSISDLKIYE